MKKILLKGLQINNLIFYLLIFCGFENQLATAQVNLSQRLLEGENLEYDLYYNWNFIWAKGGTIRLYSDYVDYNEEKAFKCSMTIATSGLADKIYRVRDTMITYLNTENLRTMSFWKAANEGKKYSAIEGGTFTYRNNEIDVYTYRQRAGHEKNEYDMTVSGTCTDAVSVVYQIRGIDLSKVVIDQDIPMKVFSGREQYNMKLRYKGNQTIKAGDKKKYDCLKFVLYVENKEAFLDEESMSFWLSNDNRRLPIQIDTKIKVGIIRGLYKSGAQ